MSIPEEFYKEVKAEDRDRSIGHKEKLEEHFFKKAKELEEKGQGEEPIRKLRAEGEAIAFAKRPEEAKEDQLHPKIKEKTEDDDPYDEHFSFAWPNIDNWEEADYEHLLQRFKDTGNLYLRSEYGLFLYCAGRLKDNRDVKFLLETLKELAVKHYQEYRANKGAEEPEKRHQLLHFTDVLRQALLIAHGRSKEAEIRELFSDLFQWIAKTHEAMGLEEKEEVLALYRLTGLASEFLKEGKRDLPVEEILKKNERLIEELKTSDDQKVVDLAKVSLSLSEKSGTDPLRWKTIIAEGYERLADEAENTPRHFTAVQFIMDAYRGYNEIGDEDGLERTAKKYDSMRVDKSYFSEIRLDLPQDEQRRIHETILREAREKKEAEVSEDLILCPMFTPLEIIQRKIEEEGPEFFQYFAGQKVVDKFGNTVKEYPPRCDEHVFWEKYGIRFQIGAQKLVKFFLEAHRSGNLNERTLIDRLQKSWMNENLSAAGHPKQSVVPLDLLRPCIRTFFRELTHYLEDPHYSPDLVSPTDALTLKLEAMLRYMCFRLGIPTFKPKPGAGENVVMEKNLDELLAALKGYLYEDDRLFFKFVMSQKDGMNLRNDVGHGLMDQDEYSIEKPILAIACLMRLCRYPFNKEEGS